jgi:hypothetical protein
MNDQKQQKRNLIPKPVQQAFYAGFSAGCLSVAFGVPFEYAPRVALAATGFSFWLSYQDSRGRTRRRRGRQVPFTSAQGRKTIDLEYAIERFVYGRKEANSPVEPMVAVPRPKELDDFIFVSQDIQLREVHVKLFLKSAWRNRQYGKGLSERRWVRNFSQRPAWYQELSTDWYYAMMRLLFNTQSYLGLHMVMMRSNRWMSLVNEPFMTLRLLKWYESERRKL